MNWVEIPELHMFGCKVALDFPQSWNEEQMAKFVSEMLHKYLADHDELQRERNELFIESLKWAHR